MAQFNPTPRGLLAPVAMVTLMLLRDDAYRPADWVEAVMMTRS